MKIDLQNHIIRSSFTSELEKKAVNIAALISRVGPMAIMNTKSYKKATKTDLFKKIFKKTHLDPKWIPPDKRVRNVMGELKTMGIVSGGVAAAGLGYSAVTKKPSIRIPEY